MKTRRIFVSLPADQWLTKQENDTKWAIVARIEELGYVTEVFTDPRGTTSLAASQAWSAVECENVMRHCDGCALLGFPRWRLTQGTAPFCLATDFNQYEGGLAHTLGLPLLVLVQEGVERRVLFDRSYKGYVGVIPQQPTPAWLNQKGFQVPFGYWREHLDKRRDVFLGYCSTSSACALSVKEYIVGELGATVLDWTFDFDPAESILQRIQEASRRCNAGIFLFTKDDVLSSKAGNKNRAVPRDNVVFEAGYFCASKEKSRVLIVCQDGAKMPADLGGDIYAKLADKDDIGPIKPVLRQFLAAL